jgi:hypothetical protein
MGGVDKLWMKNRPADPASAAAAAIAVVSASSSCHVLGLLSYG